MLSRLHLNHKSELTDHFSGNITISGGFMRRDKCNTGITVCADENV